MENNLAVLNQNTSLSLTIGETAVKELMTQRLQFEKFVKAQLKDKIDFGELPGTDKPALFKPGAEKIASLFQLGVRIFKSERTIDMDKNFALFAVTIEIYYIPTGAIICQCEGIANSREKKYRTRGVYEWDPRVRKKVKVRDEETPVGDVLNTLNKMAFKRAYVGGVIIATKASDFFNHDLSEDEEDFQAENPDHDEKVQKQADAELERIRQNRQAAEAAAAAKPAPVIIAAAKPVGDEREALAKEINVAMKAANMTGPALVALVKQKFNKTTSELTIDQMKTLIQTLKGTNQ
jgi:hypothetical protein